MLLFILSAFAVEPSPAAQSFLDDYDSLLGRLYTIDANASWDAATDVGERNEGRAPRARPRRRARRRGYECSYA